MKLFQSKRNLVKNSGLFDAQYYLDANPDLEKLDIDPLKHFLETGWQKGYNPSAHFDTKYYATVNADVLKENENPLIHYLRKGKKEGRKALPDPNEMWQFSMKATPFKKTPLLSYRNFQFAINYIKAYGLKSFFNKVLNKIFSKPIFLGLRGSNPVKLLDADKQFIPLKPRRNTVEPYDISISVIIPCLNAGDEFQFLLKVLKAQKGFKDIEIIIVDSGSTDRTLDFAERFNAKVIQIKPEEFSHSYARNLGAKHASGDFLLFTVQDALPPSDTWLHEMFTVLSDNQVAAVSCAETPREDADLFYRQICWNHYNFLEVQNADRIFSLPKVQNHISLRQNGQLSDLANLISRELFEQYQYRLNYAEDIDLGIRLIKDGYKLAFLGTTRIIHSHNRPAYYFLKRGYVDNQFLSDIFSDFEVPKLHIESFVPDIAFVFRFLAELTEKLTTLPFPISPDFFAGFIENQFSQQLSRKYPEDLPKTPTTHLDTKALSFFETIIGQNGFTLKGKPYNGFLFQAYFGYVNITTSYLKTAYETINEQLMSEIISCLYKAFSIVVGAHLAYCAKNRTGDESIDMDALHKTLMAGV